MSAPLRVTFVVPDLGAGGAERHVATLVARVDRAVVEPRVVCLGREGELFADAAAHAPAVAFGHSKRQAARSVLRLAAELRRTRPDVVVVRGYSAELMGRAAAVLARVPRTVVWVHNCDDTEPRGRVRSISDRVLEPATDAYFGVAQRQVPYIVDELGHPADKVRIIHNGVDPEAFARPDDVAARRVVRQGLGVSDDDVVIGIFAALRPEKDHETLLRAMRRVVEQAPRARLLVVGDGARRAGLQALADELGLGDRVVFTGFRDDVPRLLQAVDVFTLASFTVECFPMSLLEAMAAGRPAVCTDVGGVGEIIDEGVTGHLVPAKDEAALADRLVGLVTDPDRRASYGAAGRDRVREHFTLERSVREAERELLAVAGRAPVGSPTSATSPLDLTVVMDQTAVGGAELVTLRMFEAMDRDVVRPHLVCLREAGPLAEEFRAAGVDVVVPARGRLGALDPRRVTRLARALRDSGTDAVLVAHHHRAALVLARLAALLAGVRVVLVAPHDMDLVDLGSRVLPRSTVATLRWTSAVVLLAPSQGDYLHEHEGVGRRPWSRTREVVVANGITVPEPPAPADRAAARRTLGLADDAFVVGIVARLSEQKAHQVLLRAFVTVVASRPDAHLVVVGGGARDAELRALTHDLGLDAHVTFTGVRRDVPELLPALDVSALSSVHEAAPLTVLESMAAGVPVVATDCGALRDLFVDGVEGVLVPVGDSDALAQALLGLAGDETRRTTLGAAARRRVERDGDVAQTARGYESLLRELVTR